MKSLIIIFFFFLVYFEMSSQNENGQLLRESFRNNEATVKVPQNNVKTSANKKSVNKDKDQPSKSTKTESTYTVVSYPDRIDNGEKIKKQEAHILSLKEKKKKCVYCKGTGKERKNLCLSCHGTGTKKMIVTYKNYQYFPCNVCNQTGYRETQCSECLKTDMSLSIAENTLTSLKETDGMTKKEEETYYYIKNQEAQMRLDWQRENDAIAQPYIDRTKSSSKNSSSKTTCSYCNGTGYDSVAFVDLGFAALSGLGGYTHSNGGKCPICSRYEWHQHNYCPHCHR